MNDKDKRRIALAAIEYGECGELVRSEFDEYDGWLDRGYPDHFNTTEELDEFVSKYKKVIVSLSVRAVEFLSQHVDEVVEYLSHVEEV